jgi:hypothetical protein
MTSSEIVHLPFDKAEVGVWARSGDKRITNWPVVYILDDDTITTNSSRASDRRKNPKQEQRRKIYVGESLNVATRMRQHLASIERSHLTTLRVILDGTFNKSVCLDLESFLIEMLSGDGAFEVLNRNEGIVNADYYNRAFYQDRFDAIFDRLRLNQRANQPAATLNAKFRDITTKLFGHDDTSETQLDWVKARSTHQIFWSTPPKA